MTPIIVALAVVGALTVWFFWSTTERVPCTIDLERTHEHFHAHVRLAQEIFCDEGDEIFVDGKPITIEYGETRTMESEAVVRRASSLRRWWTRMIGRFEFYELYDVGFE